MSEKEANVPPADRNMFQKNLDVKYELLSRYSSKLSGVGAWNTQYVDYRNEFLSGNCADQADLFKHQRITEQNSLMPLVPLARLNLLCMSSTVNNPHKL